MPEGRRVARMHLSSRSVGPPETQKPISTCLRKITLMILRIRAWLQQQLSINSSRTAITKLKRATILQLTPMIRKFKRWVWVCHATQQKTSIRPPITNTSSLVKLTFRNRNCHETGTTLWTSWPTMISTNTSAMTLSTALQGTLTALTFHVSLFSSNQY